MTFVLNGKEYSTKKIDFRAMVKLEELGFNLESFQEKPFKSISIVIAFHTGLSVDKASEEISNHLEKGGEFSDLVDVLNEFNKCDFFHKMQV